MKVRIKKSPSHRTGDQFDYAAVTHPTFPNYSTGGPMVRDTIGGVPREEANIEAEGGETIIGDLNNDGNIEHFTITGKRHSQGGVPMNVPPGSFIFSDTKKMQIKDREVLDHFGMGGRKGGYTPAEISKRYKLNEFMQTINSSDADPLAKRTAQDMLSKNMTKLAELAAYQEMMKGKQPPAVSQQILGGQEEMKEGGLVKMPGGGTAENYLRPGTEIYVGNKKVKIAKVEDNWVDTDYVIFDKPVNGVSKIPKDDFIKYFNQNKQYSAITGSVSGNPELVLGRNDYAGMNAPTYNTYAPIVFGSAPQRDTSGANALDVDGVGRFTPNTTYQIGASRFKVTNPLLMQNGKRVMEVVDTDTNQKRYVTADELRKTNSKNQLVFVDKQGNFVSPGQQAVGTQSAPTADPFAIDINDAAPAKAAPAAAAPAAPAANRMQPAAKAKPKAAAPSSFNNFEDAMNSLEFGGTAGMYDFGGYVFDPTSGRMNKMAEGGDPDEKEFALGTKVVNGKTYNVVRKGNQVKFIDPATKEVAFSGEKKKNINTYDPEAVKKLEADGVKLESAMDIEQLPIVPGLQGQRTDNARIFGKRNWSQGKEYDDFKKRHGEFLSANPNFDPSKDDDVKKFQKYYNEDIRRQAKAAGYDDAKASDFVTRFGFDESRESGIPNAYDGDFGQYTWSRPKFKIEKPPAGEIPPQEKPKDPEGAGDFDNKVRRDPGGMWIQNQNAIMAAMAETPYYGAPALTQVDMVGFNPQLEEYSAKNAMLQSNLASLNNQMAMTGDASTSRAAMLGAVGRANEQGAGIIENIQNRNVGTTNQAAQINAEINNRENMANAELRKKYLDESNIYGQQLQNFFNTKRTRTVNAFNRGLAEMQNTNMVESMFPQYGVNRFNGAVVFDPTQGLSLEDDVMSGSNNSLNFNPENFGTAANQYFNAIKKSNPGISDDQAYKQAFSMVEKNFGIASRAQKGAGFMEAMRNSRMQPQQRFGGSTPSYAVGGPFYYDEYLFEV
jgi:hypothetical protein